MEKRTAVFGISEEDLNSILEQLFIRRPPYPIELSVPESPARATLNIDEAPTVDFFEDKVLSSNLQEHLRDTLFREPSIAALPDSKKESAFENTIEQIAQVGFNLRIPRCTILLSYNRPQAKSPSSITRRCAIDLIASISVNIDQSASELQVNVYDGIFTSTDAEDVSIDPIINGLVLPFLIEYLSKDRVKYNIDIPPTALANAQKLGLGVPQVTVRNHQALAFSTSGKKAPDMAAPPGSWPAGVFVGADLSVLTAAANLAASQIEKEKNFGFGNIISGEMHARFGPISDVKVIEEGSTNLSACISTDVSFNVAVSMPWSIPSFRYHLRCRIEMSATTRGEQLFLNFRYMDHLNIERLMLGIPSWLNNIFHLVGRLEAELYTRISKLVVVLIRAWEFPVCKLPPIPIPMRTKDDVQVGIRLDDVRVSLLSPGSEPLLVLCGMPTVCTID